MKKAALVAILAACALAQAPKGKTSSVKGQPRTFTGVITDSMCSRGDHSQMKMGANDAECTIACVVAHGALYVLYDGKTVYELSDQKTPEKFAGKKVRVTGTASGDKLQVRTITAAP